MSAVTRVAIVGAGPIGLEAALAAAERGLGFTVYEATGSVGGNVRQWGHVRTFTPWEMTVSPRARAALEAAGAQAPGGERPPTGDDLADLLLDPLAALPGIAGRVRTGVRVRAIAREGLLKHEEIGSERRAGRPFRLLLADPDGSESIEHADAVIDCSGTYDHPNRLGDGGIDAIGETALDDRIDRRLCDFGAEPERWAGRTILLTGAGNSAQTAARDLALLAQSAPGTRVIWAVRSSEPTWGAVADDSLRERAALNRISAELAAGASPAVEVLRGVVCERLARRDGRIDVTLRNGDAGEVTVDRVLGLNGAVGDASLYRQLQVHECYATSGPMNLAAALLGSAGGDCLTAPAPGPKTVTNPEPGFFILGIKSYGRNNQFLLRNGWEQVDHAFASLAPPAAPGC